MSANQRKEYYLYISPLLYFYDNCGYEKILFNVYTFYEQMTKYLKNIVVRESFEECKLYTRIRIDINRFPTMLVIILMVMLFCSDNT